VSLQNPTNPDHPKTKILEEFLEKLPPTPEEAKKKPLQPPQLPFVPNFFFFKRKKEKKKPSTLQRIIPLSSPLLSCPLLLSHNFCKNFSEKMSLSNLVLLVVFAMFFLPATLD